LYIVAGDESNIKLMTCGPRNRTTHSVTCRLGAYFWSYARTLSAQGFIEVDELIRLVAREAGISLDQAGRAVSAVLGFLTARLPSPVVGRIREQLDAMQSPRGTDTGDGSVR
jgi:hypothetical protein